MVNYLMEIQHKGGTFTFPITPKFFPTLQFAWKRDGKQVAVIDSVPVEGWFSDNDQDVVLSSWDTLRGIAQNGGPTVFIFRKTTGAIIQQYNRAHIQNLESIDGGGGFVNHVHFRFNIQEERGVTFPDLVDVTRSDSNIRQIAENGELKTRFRRTVSATGEFGQLQPAKNFVLALKPAFGRVTNQELREDFFDGIFTGIWDVDTSEENSVGGLRLWRETASILPGIRSGTFYRTSPGPTPVLIQGGFGPTRFRVTGHIESYDLGAIPRPGVLLQHFISQAAAVTAIHFEALEFGSYIPFEYAEDDPGVVRVFSHDYSFTLAFGEAGEPVPQVGPLVRHHGGGVIGGPGAPVTGGGGQGGVGGVQPVGIGAGTGQAGVIITQPPGNTGTNGVLPIGI